MQAVDTNVLVRLIVRDDPEQVRAAQKLIAGGAWVSQLVLAETTWVLDAVYERTSEQIAVALGMLLNHKDLSVQDADLVHLAVDQFRERPALGFSACLNLQTARRARHLPLGSFDRNLPKLEGLERLR